MEKPIWRNLRGWNQRGMTKHIYKTLTIVYILKKFQIKKITRLSERDEFRQSNEDDEAKDLKENDEYVNEGFDGEQPNDEEEVEKNEPYEERDEQNNEYEEPLGQAEDDGDI
jgi:hypothetical protein